MAESRTFFFANRPSATSVGDERGETSAVRRLGVREWRTRTGAAIFLISVENQREKLALFETV